MTIRLHRNQSILRKATVIERKLEDASFLVDEETDSIFHLNLIGSALWQLLSEPQTAAEAATLLCTAFPEMEQRTINQDTIELFQQFVDLVHAGAAIHPHRGVRLG